MKEITKIWIKNATIRAVKTIAQTAVAMIGTSVVMKEVDWVLVGSSSLLAGILSALTSLAGLPEVDSEKERILAEEAKAKKAKKSSKSQKKAKK